MTWTWASCHSEDRQQDVLGLSLWVTGVADGQGFAPCHRSSCAQVRWKTEQGLAQLVVVLLRPGHLRLF